MSGTDAIGAGVTQRPAPASLPATGAKPPHSGAPNQLSRPVRVFLVDDQAIVLKGLHLFLSRQADLEVCGEAADAVEAWQGIAAERPQVAVVDLRLGPEDCIDLLDRLHRELPEVRVLVFSMHGGAFHVRRALQAGASGYVTKQEGTKKVVEAIHRLMQGRPYLSDAALSSLGALGGA